MLSRLTTKLIPRTLQPLRSHCCAAHTKWKGFTAPEAGKALEVHEFTPMDKRNFDVDIKVVANGLCHTDVHMVQNHWGITTYPFVPGHECVGIVEDVGSDVKHLKAGDRVGVGWIRDACGVCNNCVKGQENICLNGYEGTNLGGNHGGFATHIRTPGHFAFKIPDNMDEFSAAPLLCAGITVYQPLRKYLKRPGENVGVFGIGGLGHMASLFARALGAEVTLFSSRPDKKEEAKLLGATNFVCWDDTENVKEQMGKMDLILNTLPLSMNEGFWQQAVELLSPNGMLVWLGIPVTTINMPIVPMIFGQKGITGSVVGGRQMMQEMFEFAGQMEIKPLIEKVPVNKVNEAMERVAAGKARYRVVLDNSEQFYQ